MSCHHDNQTGDFIMQVTHRKNIDRRKEKFGFDSVRFQYYYDLSIIIFLVFLKLILFTKKGEYDGPQRCGSRRD